MIDWNKTPLIPAIAKDDKGEILMLAYMNRESFERTLATKYVHYFSRSRNRIWKKGETSGHTQKLQKMWIDCDKDCLLLLVEQQGSACHTLNKTCFFTEIPIDNAQKQSIHDTTDAQVATYGILETLYHVICSKKMAHVEQSYTASLFHKGENTIGKKLVEEASELAFAIKDKHEESIIYEAADVMYHLLVSLAFCDVSPDKVYAELHKRFGVSGLVEKASRTKDNNGSSH